MRKILAVLLLAAVPFAAQAQNETVTVDATAIEGVWEFSSSGAQNNMFCRIERDKDDLAGYCTFLGPGKGSVEIEDGHLHMAWGSMALRLVIDGTMLSSTSFTGNFTAKLFGVPHDFPGPLTGTKLTLSENASDASGRAALLRHLLDEMREGKPAETFVKADGPDPTSGPPAMLAPAMLRTLGTTETIIHIGALIAGKEHAIESQVYDVEFADGERICFVNQRHDGAVDRFMCV